MYSKPMIIFLALALAIGSTGCWDRRDPELLSIVLATAFDYNAETGHYHIIAQIANPLAQETEEGEGGAEGEGARPFWVVSADGRSPYEAMRNLAEGTSRELFWAHNTVILFSEELARKGIRPVLDLFERERQLRLIARPAVVEGDLRKLMEAEFPLEQSGAIGLKRQITTIQEERGFFHTKFMTELYPQLERSGNDLFIGKIKVLEKGLERNNQEENENDENQAQEGNPMEVPPAKVGGGAAFKDDRMVGWFEPHETEGWNYVMGRIRRVAHLIESPAEKDVLLGVETLNQQVSRRPVVKDGQVRIEIALKVEAKLQEYPGHQELTVEDEFTRALAQRTAEAIRRRIEEHLNRSQELNSDVLGLGNLNSRKKPRLWEKIEKDWDDLFPKLEVDIIVEVELRRTGLVSTPIHEGGS